jgi:hypothetical protein
MTDGGGVGFLLCLQYVFAGRVAGAANESAATSICFLVHLRRELFLEGVKRKHTWIQTCIRTHKS